MIYNILGKSGIKVSKIAYGTLTTSPLQNNFSIEDSAHLMYFAYNNGINFYDTAELYNNYSHINLFLKLIGKNNRDKVVISTKSYAYDLNSAKASVQKALNEMNTDYIDIFMLHEQESYHTFRGHYEALEYLTKLKKEGIIKSVGFSTHYVQACIDSKKFNELDLVHPIYNRTGLGIVDKDIQAMEIALKELYEIGLGIFAMKPLGGGHFYKNYYDSIKYVLDKEFIHSVAIGMKSKEEIVSNIKILDGIRDIEYENRLPLIGKKLMIHDWCSGCMNCMDACHQNALFLEDNKMKVNIERCVLCGYCASKCKDFCIKVI
jgi:aryl-alcohol dehydrogenase-like predicted oxidoreductase/NAD-dependent dihydropyrimidine dehydrogenase PreA subunit